MKTTTPSTPPRLIKPGDYDYAYKAPTVRLADPGRVFAERAGRFERLAAGHALGDFLVFLAALARAQQAASIELGPVELPEEQLRLGYRHGMPPLNAQAWGHTWGQREAAWGRALRHILSSLRDAGLPDQARTAMQRLHQLDAQALDRLAHALLLGDFPREEGALAPFIAAALQVYWVKMASTLDAQALAPPQDTELCPACGCAPVAGIVRIGGSAHGLRYLVCGLCATEWHMVRIKCSNCQSTEGVTYYGVEGDKGTVKGEACEQCHTYLKLMYMERDTDLEPIADDLATLGLDVMLAEAGWQRAAPNPFLLADNS